MAELNQQLSVNGTALSNKDPDLVIKLDDHPVVQISSIQESTITYAFLTDVDSPQVYNLNLTFTYKGTLTKVIPLTFNHNPKPVPLVITDTPITATMWQRGNNIPFTATLDGTDVTSQLSSITLVPNDYIKADPNGGTKQLWSVEGAQTTPSDALTQFNFNFTYEGKVKSLSASGTFKLPAWDQRMMWMTPFTANDPLFTNIRVKVGQTATVNLMPKFRGADAYDNSASFYSAEHSDTNNGMVEFSTGTGHWSTGRPTYVKGLKVGTHKVKMAMCTSVLLGYPEFAENVTMAYWEPTIEVYDDVLTATSTDTEVSGAKGEDVTFNLTLDWNGSALALNAQGVNLAFSPTDVMTLKSVTANSVTATLVKDVPYTSTIPVSVVATYQGKTDNVDLNVTIINDVLTVDISEDQTVGGTNDTITIHPTIVYNGTIQSVNDSGLTLSVTPDLGLEIVSATAESLTLKVIDDQTAPTTFVAGLTVTKGALSATGNWAHKYTVKPTIVVSSVTASIKDTGPAPFSFTVDGEPVTPTINAVTLGGNAYVTADRATGNWTIVRADDVAKSLDVYYFVDITHDGVDYSYNHIVPFTINSLGSTVTTTPVVTTSDMVLNKESQVSFKMTQVLAGAAVTLNPDFEDMTISGPGTYVDIIPHPDNADEYVVTVKGTGVEGTYTLSGRFRNKVNGVPDPNTSYPFSVEFTAAKLASSTVTMSVIGGTTLVPVQQNTVTLALKYGTNNAVVGATARTITVTSVPNSDAILAGHGTELTAVDNQPGSYTLDINVGHKAGTIKLDLVVVIDGAQYVVDNTLVFTTPGADVLATPIVSEFNATDDATSVIEFSLAQSRLDTPSYNFTGATFKDVVGIGEIKSVSVPTVGNEGTFFVTVTGNGTAGSGTIGGTVVDVDGNEFAFDFDVTGVIPSDEFAIRTTMLTTEVNAASSNPILFVLKDQFGTPITDATKVTLDVNDSPKYRNVLAGWSNTLVNMSDTNPGQYRLSMNLGETAGTFTISLTVAVPGKTDSYKLTDMVFNNPGSPIKTATTPETIEVGEGVTSVVTLVMTRDKYLQPDSAVEGTFHIVGTTGPVSAVTPSLVQNSNGTVDLTFTSDGGQGEITVNAEIAPIVNDITWSPVPFSFKLSTAAPGIPEITESNVTPEQPMTLQLWEQKPIVIKVMAGNVDITADATVVLNSVITPNLEFVTISEGVWGFKAIVADTVEDVTLPVAVNVTVNYGGQDYTLPIEFDVTVVANTSGIPANRFNIEFI